MTLLERLKECIDIDTTLREDYISYKIDDEVFEKEVGKWKLVHEIGGDEVIRVFHLIDHDIYFQISGYYSSYNGIDCGEWDGQVYPRQVAVTQYFNKP